MGAKQVWWLLPLVCLLSACAVTDTPPVQRIGLLAPFEGRYREVGYDLLYAARLALKDAGYPNLELLAVDDGGTTETAASRARALTANPSVQVVLVAGLKAAQPDTLRAFANKPVIVVGQWAAEQVTDNVFILANPATSEALTIEMDTGVSYIAEMPVPLVAHEVAALKQLPQLRHDLIGITVISGSRFPDVQFTERYLASDLFVPEPGLLVTLGYDAAALAAQVVHSQTEAREGLGAISYNGINGVIDFEDGYWQDAPLIRYQYDATGRLVEVD